MVSDIAAGSTSLVHNPIFSPQFLPNITRFIFRSCWGAHFLGTPEAKPSSFSTPLSRDRGDVGCHRGPKAWEGWR